MAEAVREGAASVEGCRAEVVAITEGDFQGGCFVNEGSLTAGDVADAFSEVLQRTIQIPMQQHPAGDHDGQNDQKRQGERRK